MIKIAFYSEATPGERLNSIAKTAHRDAHADHSYSVCPEVQAYYAIDLVTGL